MPTDQSQPDGEPQQTEADDKFTLNKETLADLEAPEGGDGVKGGWGITEACYSVRRTNCLTDGCTNRTLI